MPDHEAHDVAGIAVNEHASVVKRIGERIVGFVETERQRVSSSGAHLVEGGSTRSWPDLLHRTKPTRW